MDKQDKILLVVDYQKDFVDGALGFPKAVTLEKPMIQRIEEALKEGWTVIFTKDTHYSYYLNTQEGERLPVPHCTKYTLGWELYGGLEKFASNKNVMVINKNTFGSTELIDILRSDFNDVDEIEICGIVTNMCVISNAVGCKMALPEARIVINSNLCASFDDALHDKALEVMTSMQMDVI